jgi:small subunit ribosomal protein S4
MGDPRKIRRKYDKPSHPWQGSRIKEENQVVIDYGLSSKKEIWKMKTILREFKNQVKSLASRIDDQSKLEEKQLVDRLISIGLMKHDDQLDKVLGLQLKDIMDRRLQTVLVKKGLARSMKQSRQFVTHGHIIVNKKKITFPSYVISLKEEGLIEFVPTSTLAKEDHPERAIKESAKDKDARKKKERKEEAPPTFAAEEIVQIEEVGAVVKPVKGVDAEPAKEVPKEVSKEAPKAEAPVKKEQKEHKEPKAPKDPKEKKDDKAEPKKE